MIRKKNQINNAIILNGVTHLFALSNNEDVCEKCSLLNQCRDLLGSVGICFIFSDEIDGYFKEL